MRLFTSLLCTALLAASASGAHARQAQAPGATAPGRIVFGSCAERPVYPPEALREKRAGNLAVSFLIDSDNAVLDSKVKRSSGHADLDEAARVGLSKCKFKAATRDGQPVQDWVTLEYKWALP